LAANEKRIIVDATEGVVCRKAKRGFVPFSTHLENGYQRITISDQFGKFNAKVHRVIWIAVHGIPADRLVVCHRDNDKTNNRIANLFLQTKEQNVSDAWRDGLMRTWKLSAEQRQEMLDMHLANVAIWKIAELFDVRSETVRRTIRKLERQMIG